MLLLDDGLDYTHPDLTPGYYAAASYNFNDESNDPEPDGTLLPLHLSISITSVPSSFLYSLHFTLHLYHPHTLSYSLFILFHLSLSLFLSFSHSLILLLVARGDFHGTASAGLVVGRSNNGVCGVGVAPRALGAGIRLLSYEETDEVRSNALVHWYIHYYYVFHLFFFFL